MEDLNDGEGRLTQEEYDNLYNEIIDPITISGLTEAKVQLVDFQRKLNEAEAACREEEGYLSFRYGE
ncbi:MAG: hypothetical protein Q4C83_01455 [Candidatus Saccharibacteria bacterium]|nr:hypothetical protein [Candidatus Saccharibacteria bacterium]